MYFKDRDNTNIDQEFDGDNLFSKIIKTILKLKWFIIIGILILVVGIVIFLTFNKKVVIYLDLHGEQELTLYEDTDYIEPGFSAYDSKKVDLTSDVVITSTLDTSKIGEYKITYSLGDIKRVRKVKVIDKSNSNEYVYIKLNAIDNNVNVYLNVGDKYVEPGYKVYSSSDEDLTSKVEVSGTIDTSKKGNYKLVYTVVDGNGITTSTSRLVVVMDSVINLSLNDTKYTNDKVVINVSVADEYFDYLILPNGNRITKNMYSYEVSQNGNYVFKSYNKKGIEKVQTIKVSNIDKTLPTGSCSGNYKNGKSNININANDDNGISKYVINNQSYTSNQITVNGELKTVNVIIYDKAGNMKTISCNLENKNGSSPTPNPSQPSSSLVSTPSFKDNPIYKQEKFHDNSINGIRFILYNQHDDRWGNTWCRGSSTFAESGCVSTSTAVVLSSYDTSFQPVDVPVKYRNEWPTNSINDLANGAYSCVMQWGGDVRKLLLEGKVIIIEVRGKDYGANSNFTNISHYMSLVDYDKKNDRIFVGNGYGNHKYGMNGWFSASEVLNSVYSVHICTPSEELLKKYKY